MTKEVQVDWEAVESLTDRLLELEPELTKDQQRTLMAVFDVAGVALESINPAERFGARFVPGASGRRPKEALKVSYSVQPTLGDGDPKPPDDAKCTSDGKRSTGGPRSAPPEG